MAKRSSLELRKDGMNDLATGEGRLLLQALNQRSMFWRPAYLEQSAWLEHIPFAFWLVEAHKSRIFVELGTHYGVSYFAFCQAIQRLGLDTRCFAVDTWKGDEHAGFYGEEVFEQVKAHNDAQYSSFSRLVRSTFDEALEYFEDSSVDLLHIDGLHTFEAVQHDFESWLPKLSSHAIVLMHDTNVRERGFGVAKFFKSLKEKYPHFEFLHGHGLGVLRVGSKHVELIQCLFQANEANYTRQAIHEVFGRLGRACADTLDAANQKKVIRTLESEVEKLKKQLDNYQHKLDAAQRNLSIRDKEWKDIKLQLVLKAKQHALQRGQLTERVNLLQEFRTDLKDEVTRLQDRIEQSAIEIKSRTDEVYQFSLINQQHQRQLEENSILIASYKKSLNDKTLEVKNHKIQLDSYKKLLQLQENVSQDLEAKIAVLKETVQQYQVEIKETRDATSQAQAVAREIKKQLSVKEEVVKDLTAKLEAQRKQLELEAATTDSTKREFAQLRDNLVQKVKEAETQHKKIETLQHVLLQAKAETANLRQEFVTSTSWKLTAPLRAIKSGPAKIARAVRLTPTVIRFGGGVLPTARKAARILFKEGLAGVKRRLGYVKSTDDSGNPPAITADLFAELSDAYHVVAEIAGTRITIVLPVYNTFDLLSDVLQRISDHTDLPWHLIIVEDCSTDKRVRPFLRKWVQTHEIKSSGCVTLLENRSNKGFIHSVNSALARAMELGNHVVLLNSDTFVPDGWASRLIRPILTHDNVATVTPMSNDAEIFSVPVICRRTQLETGQVDAIDALARMFHPDAELSVAPTGVGFCMAMNIKYLSKVGMLDTSFGRGYGEEVDWCQKARSVGGRHLGLPGLFVEHRGGMSFGSTEKRKLVEKNNLVISKRYPAYDREVQNFIRHDPLSTPRLALAIAWAIQADSYFPIYLAHSIGGGADMYLNRRIADDLQAGRRVIILRVGGTYRWQIELHSEVGISRGFTDSFELIRKLLEPVLLRRVIYSCGVGDRDPVDLPRLLLALKKTDCDKIEVLFHDFFPLSPSYCLLNEDGRYRGLPDPKTKDSAHTAFRPNGRRVSLHEWQASWRSLLDAADEIVTFSDDSRTHVLKVFPHLAATLHVRPHEKFFKPPKMNVVQAGTPVVGVLGNIGRQKGAGVLLSLSNLTQKNDFKLVVVGNVDPNFPLKNFFCVHGNYKVDEIPALIRKYGITCWFIPSIWPETFSFTTHEALATGLPVYCFDLGAQAEAIRRAPNGIIVPFHDKDDELARNFLDLVIKKDRYISA